MRKLFFSCLRSEERLCKAFGFYPPVGSYLLAVLLRRAAPFIPFAFEPECLVHLIPTSGARDSVSTLMQAQPLNLPFLQRLACTLRLHLSWLYATSLHGAEMKWKKLSTKYSHTVKWNFQHLVEEDIPGKLQHSDKQLWRKGKRWAEGRQRHGHEQSKWLTVLQWAHTHLKWMCRTALEYGKILP